MWRSGCALKLLARYSGRQPSHVLLHGSALSDTGHAYQPLALCRSGCGCSGLGAPKSSRRVKRSRLMNQDIRGPSQCRCCELGDFPSSIATRAVKNRIVPFAEQRRSRMRPVTGLEQSEKYLLPTADDAISACSRIRRSDTGYDVFVRTVCRLSTVEMVDGCACLGPTNGQRFRVPARTEAVQSCVGRM